MNENINVVGWFLFSEKFHSPGKGLTTNTFSISSGKNVFEKLYQNMSCLGRQYRISHQILDPASIWDPEYLNVRLEMGILEVILKRKV